MRREQPARGPRPSYSRAQIVHVAIRIADAEGLESASTRRIAAELGAGVMSLYRYVPSREELIELMMDAVYAECALPEAPSDDWYGDLKLVANELRALGHRHAWLATLTQSSPVLGPNTLRLVEFGCGTLDARGVPVDEAIVLMRLLEGYVWHFVREELASWEAERRTGLAWQHRTAERAYVRDLVESGEYPVFARLVGEAQQPHMEADVRFQFGLERVLSSIAASLSPGQQSGEHS